MGIIVLVLGAIAVAGQTSCSSEPDLAGVGEPCTTSEDCGGNTSCFNTQSSGPVCMNLCSAGDRLCDDGAVCLESATSDEHVCYIGGTTAIGSPCTSGTECEVGGVCINDGTDTLCRQACSTDDGSACAANEECAPTTEPPEGFCRAAGGDGDGDGDADGDGDGDGDGDADGCPGEIAIEFGTPTRGDTSSGGWDQGLSDWFDNSDVACMPGTQSDQYPAPYQVYSIDMPAHSDWDVGVVPDEGVDVSIVSWIRSADDSACYPERGYSVITCEAANSGGPGEPEVVWMSSVNNPYKLVILVTTPTGGTPGGFVVGARPHE